MPVTTHPRTLLPNWSAGTDPLTRAQLDNGFASIESLMALDAQGTLAARPLASSANRGLYYYATDNGFVYRSDGVVWVGPLNPGVGGAAPPAIADAGAAGAATIAAARDHTHAAHPQMGRVIGNAPTADWTAAVSDATNWQDIPNMSLVIPAQAAARRGTWQAVLVYAAHATPDVQIRIQQTGGTDAQASLGGVDAADAHISPATRITGFTGEIATFGGAGVASRRIARLFGIITAGVAAGTFKLQTRQAVAHATAHIIYSESIIQALFTPY